MSARLTKALSPFAVKATDDDAMTFSGLASTWELDLGGDVILPGAFTRTLEDWRGSKKVIPLIDQHNYGSVRAVVGKLTEAKETAEGLHTEWQIIDTDDGREVYHRLKGGYIDGLSIGYRVIGEPEVKDGIRQLPEVALEEVSVVIWPMNPGARTGAVKALEIEQLAAAIQSLGRKERRALREILDQPVAAEALAGLDPDDPERVAAEDRFRRLVVQSLAV